MGLPGRCAIFCSEREMVFAATGTFSTRPSMSSLQAHMAIPADTTIAETTRAAAITR
jgi:hypothetical protein